MMSNDFVLEIELAFVIFIKGVLERVYLLRNSTQSSQRHHVSEIKTDKAGILH